MQLFLSHHCVQRMHERGVALEQVEQVLKHPLVVRQGSNDSVILESRIGNGARLKVYVKGGFPLGSRVIIITVAWSER